MARNRPAPFEREKGSHASLLARLRDALWPVNPVFFHDMLVGLGYRDIAALDDRSLKAAKSNYTFTSQVSGLSFRFDSNRGSSLIDAQRELFAVLARDYRTHMEDHVAYYEMVYSCEHTLDEPVDVTYARTLDDSGVKSLFESVTGRNLGLNKLAMSSGSRVGDTDWYSIEISTRVESYGNALFCQMTRRSPDLKEAHKAARGASEIINNLVDRLTAAR